MCVMQVTLSMDIVLQELSSTRSSSLCFESAASNVVLSGLPAQSLSACASLKSTQHFLYLVVVICELCDYLHYS